MLAQTMKGVSHRRHGDYCVLPVDERLRFKEEVAFALAWGASKCGKGRSYHPAVHSLADLQCQANRKGFTQKLGYRRFDFLISTRNGIATVFLDFLCPVQSSLHRTHPDTAPAHPATSRSAPAVPP